MKAPSAAVTTFSEPPPAKKPKIEQQTCDPNPTLNAIWITLDGCLMTETELMHVNLRRLLNNDHIDFAQHLLIHQFSSRERSQYTILQTRNCLKRSKMVYYRLSTAEGIIGYW